MKILIAWPPQEPSFFNDCYHFAYLGEVAGYLRNKGFIIKILDGGIRNPDPSLFKSELAKEYDVLAIFNFPENAKMVRELAELSRQISPNTKIITYGFASSLIPNFFKKYPIDAICINGEWSLYIEKFALYLSNKIAREELCGIFLNENGAWIETKKGEILSSREFGFPALDLLPINTYMRQTLNNKRNQKLHMSLTISKGCPNNCIFCQMSKVDGLMDRRRSVKDTLDFIENSMQKYNFRVVTLYSPTFTLNKRWVLDFCKEISLRKLNFKWKCTTSVFNIDEELIASMSRAGCYKIGFGIETLQEVAQKNIHKIIPIEKVEYAIRLCTKYHITSNCFIMLGIPGQTKDGILNTITKLIEFGGKPRATIYSPLQELSDNMSEEELIKFNKARFQDLDAQPWV